MVPTVDDVTVRRTYAAAKCCADLYRSTPFELTCEHQSSCNVQYSYLLPSR
jgi:hypothetical protein